MSTSARRTVWMLLAAAALGACGGGGGGGTSPVVRSITPSSGFSGSATPVVISGDNFLVSPDSSRIRAWLDDAELTGVTRVDVQTLHATVPAGLPAGTKTLRVENAYGRQGRLANAFRVESLSLGALAVSVEARPATGSVGQAITLQATVQNVGTGAVTEIQPNEVLVASADGAAATVAAPDPPSVASLAQGASATFTWQVVLTAVGHMDLTVSVAGNDAFSGQKVPSPPVSAPVVAELPAGLVATISASRQSVNTGEPVTLTLTVTNGGEAAARVDEVTQQVQGGSATCGSVTPSLPVTVPNGESRSFAWSCTAAVAASLSLSGTVAGVDVNSSLPISASPAVPAAVEVQTPAALAATLAVDGAPATASVGQSLTVRLTVRDTGGASADVTSVGLSATAGAVACTALGPATPQTLDGGASLAFGWTCIPATAGPLNLRGTVAGSDGNTGAPLSASASLPAPITVQLPPGLAATVTATSSSSVAGAVDVNQDVTVSLTVTNGGGAWANGVAVTPSTGGTASATCGVATPTAANIAPNGGSQLYSWTCRPSSAGTLSLTGTAAGTDANSGLAVSATPLSPASVTVQTPAALTAALAVDGNPTAASVGQSLTVRLTVEDSGGASATVASVTATPPGICTAATPSPPQVVSPGAGVTFTWTCTPASAGSLTLGATLTGSDRNSGAPLSASAALATPITVQQPPVLTATVAASPTTADVGQDVTMTFTVRNGGGVGANGVAVAPTATGTAVSCGPVAPAAATIGPGGSQVYTRTCTPNGAGTLVLSGTATGTDANSGQTVTATPAVAASVTVQVPAALAASLEVVGDPATASVGQVLNVRLTVSDTGGASATVAAVAPTPAGICTDATPVPPQTVTPPATVTFTWTCTPAAAGSLTLGASVTGADVNSAAPLSASASLAAPITVQLPPALVATVAASPGTVDVGQAVVVTFTVANGGGVRANGVAVTPSHGGTAAASCGAAAPVSAGIDPAGAEQYAWTCTASSAGTLVLSGAAAGTDANSGLPVAATPAVAASVAVQVPAALSASIGVIGDPITANVGQALAVQLTVSDTGEASATVASVTPTPAGICTSATPLPPQTVAPPATVTFGWTCTPTSAGPLTLGASVAGADVNSGAPLSASASLAAPIEVADPPLTAGALQVTGALVAGTPGAVGASLPLANGGSATAQVAAVVPSSDSGAVACGPAGQTLPLAQALPVEISPGGAATFGWTCDYDGSGAAGTVVTLGAAAAATDLLSGADVSPVVGSATVTLEPPP